MPNDILSLPLPSTGFVPGFRRAVALVSRVLGAAVALASLVALPGCGAEEDNGVTYNDDVRPIFNRRCTNCHRPGGPSGIDIQNPFSMASGLDSGLVGSSNFWNVTSPSLPRSNVAPNDPNNSFLMYKISDASTGLLPPDPDGANGPLQPPGGSHMPLQIPALSQAAVGLLEDWITAGAPKTNFADRDGVARDFDRDIRRPIFGDEAELRARNGVCDLATGQCARCIYCHYAGTPNPPDLTDPFGPDGLVEVKAIYRADKVRVKRGSPADSFLIDKVSASRPASEYGAQMPYSYTALTSMQVDTVRQWIIEGARP